PLVFYLSGFLLFPVSPGLRTRNPAPITLLSLKTHRLRRMLSSHNRPPKKIRRNRSPTGPASAGRTFPETYCTTRSLSSPAPSTSIRRTRSGGWQSAEVRQHSLPPINDFQTISRSG